MPLFRSTRPLLALALVLALVAIAVPLLAAAQANPPAPTFDVASIRQDKTDPPRWTMSFTPDGVSGKDVTLALALREAYDPTQQWAEGGSPWLATTRFDIEAKFDVTAFPHPTLEERCAMLQALLIDRFQLKIHHEQRDFPLYELAIAKGGSKLPIASPADVHVSPIYGPMCQIRRVARGVTGFRGCSMADLADHLTQAQHSDSRRIVEDKTGLTQRYSFDLAWAPDPPSTTDGGPGAEPVFLGPTLETALREQLGLKLVPSHGPLDVIVIDHAEMPSGN
jgi:uncharacterized protein (TIGR03435 family)